MINTRVCLLLLAVLALCFGSCASWSAGTTAALGAGIVGAIAGLQEALANGSIDPELGGNLLAVLTVVQQQMGEHAAVVAAATKMAAEVSSQLATTAKITTDVSTQLAATQGTLSDVQTTGIVSGAAIGAYALRKPAVATALAVLRGLAHAGAAAKGKAG